MCAAPLAILSAGPAAIPRRLLGDMPLHPCANVCAGHLATAYWATSGAEGGVSERRESYSTQCLLKPDANSVMMTTELDLVRGQLADLERQLLSLLVTVQRAQGKEPNVLTRSERRGR